jgi:hypothetical protein
MTLSYLLSLQQVMTVASLTPSINSVWVNPRASAQTTQAFTSTLLLMCLLAFGRSWLGLVRVLVFLAKVYRFRIARF